METQVNQNNQQNNENNNIANNEMIIKAIEKAVEQSIKDNLPGLNDQELAKSKELAEQLAIGIFGSKVKDTQTNTEEVSEMILDQGWLDEKTGKIDASKVKNPEVLAALQLMESRYNQEREDRMISDAITEQMKNYSLNMSDASLRKLLDTSGIKIKDGKVTGVTEAFEALKSAEPAFFKAAKEKSSPLSESFNPVNKSNSTDIPTNLSQAFSMMEN